MANTKLLEKKFEQMGARVKIETLGNNPFASPVFNVRNDKKGEIFEITVGADSPASIEVLDVQPKDRHMLVLVREPEREVPMGVRTASALMSRGMRQDETRKLAASKSKYLLGHDERHWFVAAVPEDSSASNVQTAKEALQPKEVQQELAQKKVKTKKRNKRKNEAFKRQGEWFFLPRPKFQPDDEAAVLTKEPLLRGGDRFRGGGKPHTMEFCYRRGGTTVYVNMRHPRGLTEREWKRLPEDERNPVGDRFRVMTRDAEVYAKGAISHSDHATIYLECWHRIVMNTENRARAMANVAFLD